MIATIARFALRVNANRLRAAETVARAREFYWLSRDAAMRFAFDDYRIDRVVASARRRPSRTRRCHRLRATVTEIVCCFLDSSLLTARFAQSPQRRISPAMMARDARHGIVRVALYRGLHE